MSRTVLPPRPLVSTDGRADARGSVTVSTATARAVLAALAGLTVHPWPGVEHGEGRPALTLSAALEGVPVDPAAILLAVDALEAAGSFESGGNLGFWRPNVVALDTVRYCWRPFSGRDDREIVIHFRYDDAVISWRSDVTVYRQVPSDGWTDRAPAGKVGHRSRFIGRIVSWASPRSVAVAPMQGHSGPVRAL